jgi:hypothetical protein
VRECDVGDDLQAFLAASRRAFGLVEPSVLDRDRGLAGQERDELLILGVEVGTARLLGEVEVAVGDAAQPDRRAEERPHRRVVGGKPDRTGVLAEVVQPQGARVLDQHAEDATAPRELPDRGPRLLVDAGRHEPLEGRSGPVDHAESGIPGVRQERRGLDDPLQERLE